MGTNGYAGSAAKNEVTVRAKKIEKVDSLRVLAGERGVEPIVLLKSLIKSHATLEAAAEELGMTDRGFRKLRARYGVKVVRS